MNKESKTKSNKHLKILLISGGFFPGKKYGGIVTSRLNFCEALKSVFDIYVLTSNHDYNSNVVYENIDAGWNGFRGYQLQYINDKQFGGKYIKTIIDSIKPDLIYMSGTITSFFKYNRFALKYAKKRNIPCLISPDGDLGTNALSIKTSKKRFAAFICRFFKVFDKVFFYTTSKEEKDNLISFLKINQTFVYEGTNISYPIISRDPIIKKKNSLRAIYSSRIHKQKNLLFVLKCFQQLRLDNLYLDIYGEIEDLDYWKECKSIIDTNKNIKYLGLLDIDEARDIYKRYDCLLMPTLGENYSHTIEESIMCGCPVLLTKGVTPWDSINGEAGFLFDENDQKAFISLVNMLYSFDNNEYSEIQKTTRTYAITVLDTKKKSTIFVNTVFDIVLKQRGFKNE